MQSVRLASKIGFYSRRQFSTERIKELETQVAELQSKLKNLEFSEKKSGGIRALITEKGVPFVIWYGAIWAGGVGGFWGLLEAEWISYDSIVSFAKYLGADKLYDLNNLDPKTGKLAVAFLANELAEPLRLPLAIVTLTPVMRGWSKIFSRIRRS